MSAYGGRGHDERGAEHEREQRQHHRHTLHLDLDDLLDPEVPDRLHDDRAP